MIIFFFIQRLVVPYQPGLKVIKIFSCSTLLRVKLKMSINIEIAKINRKFGSKSSKPVIYPANKC